MIEKALYKSCPKSNLRRLVKYVKCYEIKILKSRKVTLGFKDNTVKISSSNVSENETAMNNMEEK